jgi:hypothetical protein
MTVELEDPKTGRAVTVVAKAQLRQSCPICGGEMMGTPIAGVEGARWSYKALGWFHLGHLESVLLVAPPKRRHHLEAAT